MSFHSIFGAEQKSEKKKVFSSIRYSSKIRKNELFWEKKYGTLPKTQQKTPENQKKTEQRKTPKTAGNYGARNRMPFYLFHILLMEFENLWAWVLLDEIGNLKIFMLQNRSYHHRNYPSARPVFC